MTDPKPYEITITLGPVRFYNCPNQRHEAQRLAAELRQLVGRSMAMKGTRNSKTLRADVLEMHPDDLGG